MGCGGMWWDGWEDGRRRLLVDGEQYSGLGWWLQLHIGGGGA